MIYIKWLLKRLIFLRRIIIELYNKAIYQKESQFILHPSDTKRCPYEAILFYNLLGRIFFGLKEIIALSTNNKIFRKSIVIDSFDETVDYKSLYAKGADRYLYPKSPLIKVEEIEIDDLFYEKISNSYFMAYDNDNLSKDLTEEWTEVTELYRDIFFQDKKIIREKIENFRGDSKIYKMIFNNDFLYVEKETSYIKNYMNAIDLILEYHKQAIRMDNIFLSSLSDSTAGNHLCINYRGKKLSKELIYHGIIAHDIVKNVPLPSKGKREIILDIGAGFGGTARLLHYYREDSSQILVDLPETLLLTAYYLKDNFPHKKIALLEDIIDDLEDFNKIIEEYDFILVPPFVLTYIKDQSIDLVMNTTSLGFMSEKYLNYYLEHAAKILKDGGYFYSLNSTKSVDGGIGSYDWDYKGNYLTVAYNFDNRFTYPQWLGKKLK
ncbi:MAG TPA: putative sugar O-methyltransferase [Arcobacter sp.]|nr:putative sugar O-methyltransferase [Arcobacter sp.]